MGERNFRELLETRWSYGNFVCVGLDSDLTRIPQVMRKPNAAEMIFAFNQAIVEATMDLVRAYKPNIAFYEACGDAGWHALAFTIAYIQRAAPRVPVILGAKRADIGNTNKGYVQAAFGHLEADAITVHPYLGAEALQPFLARAEKGVIVLCRTSNPGAAEFQDLRIKCFVDQERDEMIPLYQYVAKQVAREWNKNGNCALVVGATYPDEIREVREIIGDMPILIPGIGAQGGDIEKAVKAGKDSRGKGMIINSSSGIIFASSGMDFAEAARQETIKLRDAINQYSIERRITMWEEGMSSVAMRLHARGMIQFKTKGGFRLKIHEKYPLSTRCSYGRNTACGAYLLDVWCADDFAAIRC